jgi:hypothetical protein
MGDVSVTLLQNFLECDNNFKRELCNLRADIKQHLSTFVVADFTNTDSNASDVAAMDAGSMTRNVVLSDLFCDTLYKLVLSGLSPSAALQVGWQYDKNFFITADTFLRLLSHFGFDSICTPGDMRLLLWTYSKDNTKRSLVNISEMNKQNDKIVCWLNFLTWLHWSDSEPYAAVSHRLVARAVLLWSNEVSSTSQRLILQWPMPEDITYGTPLTELQLNAVAETSKIAGVTSLSSIEGQYRYTPGFGDVLDAGQHVLRAVFVPNDLAKYQIAEKAITLNVLRIQPRLTWGDIETLICGEELGDKHLQCRCLEPGLSGTFFYSKTFGHVFQDPGAYEIVCTFVPDNANYAKATKTNSINVVPPDTGKKDATIVWGDDEYIDSDGPLLEIRVGEELTDQHLRARVLDDNAEGSFFYSRSHQHTFLKPGEFEVTATFVPHENSAKFLRKSSKSVLIRVLEPRIKTSVVWNELPEITYGTKLSEHMLSCYAADSVNNEFVEGRFEFSHDEGTVLDAGTHIITATFYPRNPDMYEGAERNMSLVVRKVVPRIVWEDPIRKEIAIDEELGDNILTAYCRDDLEGTMTYNYSFGHVFTKPGEVTIMASFLPADSVNYVVATRSLTIRVVTAKPLEACIYTEPYIRMEYGDILYEEMLNCRLVVELLDQEVDGHFVFSPPLEDIQCRAGDYLVSVNFVAVEKCLRLNISPAKVEVHVAKAEPEIEWDTVLASMFVGDALTEKQLNAKCVTICNTVPVTGQFFYSKEFGVVMTAAGSFDIVATFVPNDPWDTNFKKIAKTARVEVFQGADDCLLEWEDPLPIDYGVRLSEAQLCPVVTDKFTKRERRGKFDFSPCEGIILPAGRHTLSVTFTPEAVGSAMSNPITKTVRLTVNRAAPIIEWPTDLGRIAVGQPLAAAEIFTAHAVTAQHIFERSAVLDGQFVYSVPEGHVFDREGDVDIVVTFTPNSDGISNYQPAIKTAVLHVIPKLDTSIDISWTAPDPISYGIALSAEEQYNVRVKSMATKSTIPGKTVFNPPIGTLLPAGVHTLTVTFHPDDEEHYKTSSKQHLLTVHKAVPVLVWEEPEDPLVVGQELTSRQLCARCIDTNVVGTIFYTHSLGQSFTLAGLHRVTATFVPTPPYDSNFVSNSHKAVFITVNDREEEETKLIWESPAPINYGTPLNHLQLNAVAVYARTNDFASGTYIYDPPVGTILSAGNTDLSVTFRHSDHITHPNVLFATVSITVNKSAPKLKWVPSLSPLTTNQPLTVEFLHIEISNNVAGRFMYEPGLGHVFPEAGVHTILVLFFPDAPYDEDYRQASVTIKLPVLEHHQGHSTVMAQLVWDTPKDIYLGTALGPEQLNAMCLDRDNAAVIDGTFTYTPPAGSVLGEGMHSIRVIFTPKNKKKYGEIYSSEVMLKVIDKRKLPHLNQVKPVRDAVRTKTGYVSVAKMDICRSMVFHRMVLNSRVLKKSKFGDMEVSMRVSSHELSPVEMLDIVDRVNGTVNFYCQSKFLELSTEDFLSTHLIVSLRGHSIITKKRVEYYCSVSVPLVEFMNVNEGPFTISLVAHPKLYFPDQGLTMRTDALNEQCKMQIAIVAHAYEPVSATSAAAGAGAGVGTGTGTGVSASDTRDQAKQAHSRSNGDATKSRLKPKSSTASQARGKDDSSSPMKTSKTSRAQQAEPQQHYGNLRGAEHVARGNTRTMTGSASAPNISAHNASTPMSLYPFDAAGIDYGDSNNNNQGDAGDHKPVEGNLNSAFTGAADDGPRHAAHAASNRNVGSASKHGKSSSNANGRSRPISAPLTGKRLDFTDVNVPFNAKYSSNTIHFTDVTNMYYNDKRNTHRGLAGDLLEENDLLPTESNISPALASLIDAAADNLIRTQHEAFRKERRDNEAANKSAAIHEKVGQVNVAYGRPSSANNANQQSRHAGGGAAAAPGSATKPKKSSEWH